MPMHDNAIHLDELDPRYRRKKEKAALLTKLCGLCAFCGAPNPVTIDHIIPQSQAPHLKHYWGNLVPACPSCNGAKSDRPWLTWYRAQPFYSDARARDIAALLGEWGLQ
jgi:5-methylcytosine-specific restriction endonuclease McrA